MSSISDISHFHIACEKYSLNTWSCLALIIFSSSVPQLDKLDDMIENNTDLIDHATAMAALFTNYDGAFKSLRFKPSSYKDNALLAHVSTNLHRQVCGRFRILKHSFNSF